MATEAGNAKIRESNLARDPEYYKKLGKIGGSSKHTRPNGFATMPREKVVEAGRKGGLAPKRYKYEEPRQV